MRNTIGTIKVGALTDDKFTNANLTYVCGKVQQWAVQIPCSSSWVPPG